MTERKLEEITSKVADIFRCDALSYFSTDNMEEKENAFCDLLDVVASLHNELYKEVIGEYYDYMFHWANHGYGGSPKDNLFKEADNEHGM